MSNDKPTPYNPLDKINLAQSIATAMLMQYPLPIAQTEDVIGAGVYAIYYTGEFDLYQPISQQNKRERFEQPIYVGKAIPKGGRRGGLTLDSSAGTALRDRLRKHASSVENASNLDQNDFFFRWLMVDDIWIPLGENILIERFKPLWNQVIDGFGNNDPGGRRATQYRSYWDVLHPGRPWAVKLAQGETTVAQICEKAEQYFTDRD